MKSFFIKIKCKSLFYYPQIPFASRLGKIRKQQIKNNYINFEFMVNQDKMKAIHWIRKCKSMRYCVLMGLFLLNTFAATSQDFNDSHYIGTWVFSHAEVQENPSRANMKNPIGLDEIYSQNYWNLVPLRLQFAGNGFLGITTPTRSSMARYYEWILIEQKRLNVLQPRESRQITEQEMLEIERHDMDVFVSYSNVQVSGNILSLQYDYFYKAAENEYVNGVLTVYLKQE